MGNDGISEHRERQSRARREPIVRQEGSLKRSFFYLSVLSNSGFLGDGSRKERGHGIFPWGDPEEELLLRMGGDGVYETPLKLPKNRAKR